MITVITSFSPEGYDQYGRKFIETFREFWPSDINLLCAWEGFIAEPGLNGFDLFSYEPCRLFLAACGHDPEVRGLKESIISPWSPKSRRLGYSFRHNAYKFGRKVFAVAAASKYVEGGRLFWIDADVVTYNMVDRQFLRKLLPDTISLCYLPRLGYHSELGFVGYNLHRKETRDFITAYENQYSNDLFLKDPHWDDCNQFDYLVTKLNPSTKPIVHSRAAQPFDDSILGHYMRHNKGRRKAA